MMHRLGRDPVTIPSIRTKPISNHVFLPLRITGFEHTIDRGDKSILDQLFGIEICCSFMQELKTITINTYSKKLKSYLWEKLGFSGTNLPLHKDQ